MKRKIIYGFLAALIALGLWMYVVTVVNPEWEDTFHNIPVVLENEEVLNERGLMLISDADPKVTLRLSGNRADMIKLNSSNITIRADLSRIYSTGEQRLAYSIVYPGDVPNNAFEIISQTPQQITLKVVERKSKAVDVVLKIGEADAGYKVLEEDIILSDKKITIVGPADVIDRIVTAEITVDLAGQKGTFIKQYDYVLRDAEGNAVESKWVKATPENVECTMTIEKMQEVEIAVDILEGAGLTGGKYQVTYYDQDTGEIINAPIEISGSETQLQTAVSEGLLRDNKLFFDEVIDLSKIAGTATDNGLEIVLEDLNLDALLAPYEITNHSEINTIKVVIQIPKLTTKVIRVSALEAVNIPTGLSVEMKTKYLDVIVRGPDYEVNWITEKDFKITMDFADATEVKDGSFVATVTLNKGKETFVVGSYIVKANVALKNS